MSERYTFLFHLQYQSTYLYGVISDSTLGCLIHCTRGAGRPVAEQVNRTLSPSLAVTGPRLVGVIVITGGATTSRTAVAEITVTSFDAVQIKDPPSSKETRWNRRTPPDNCSTFELNGLPSFRVQVITGVGYPPDTRQ